MFIEFDYLKKFQCIGSLCSNTCCAGWDIHVDQETLSKVSNTKNKLAKRLLLNKIVDAPRSEYPAKIKNNNEKKCSFLEKDNLCLVQKKDQTEFLPLTCRTFPRRFIQFPESKFTSCSFSCPEIGKLVLFNKKIPRFLLNSKTIDKINFPEFNNPNQENQNIIFAKNGTKILNLVKCLFEKKINIKVILLIINQIAINRSVIESNPSRIEEIFNLIESSLTKRKYIYKINIVSEILFFKGIFEKIRKSEAIKNFPKIIKNFILFDFENLFIKQQNFERLEKSKSNFDKFLKKYPLLKNNYFMNEIFGKLQYFTNNQLNLENMIIQTILIFLINNFIFINTMDLKKDVNEKEFITLLSQNSRIFAKIDVEQVVQEEHPLLKLVSFL